MRTSRDQPGWAVWLTGLPASGKSTLAAELAKRLERMGQDYQVLESDALRQRLTPGATYSEVERYVFYAALAWMGTLLTRHGVAVIFDATAHRRAYREVARREIPRFLEVWVDCPLAVCRGRDPKGIYQAAARGEARQVPGIGVAYQPNVEAELVIDSAHESPAEAADRIVAALQQRGWLGMDGHDRSTDAAQVQGPSVRGGGEA